MKDTYVPQIEGDPPVKVTLRGRRARPKGKLPVRATLNTKGSGCRALWALVVTVENIVKQTFTGDAWL